MKLIKFYANWCQPCKALDGLLEKFKDNELVFSMEKVDIDKNIALTKEYGIRGIPALLMVDDSGKVVKTLGNTRTIETISEFLK